MKNTPKTLLALSLAALPLAFPPVARAGQIELANPLPPGSRADTASGTSVPLQLSMDGRYLLFASNAANLVPGQRDDNFGNDLFLFDRATGVKTLVTHKAGAGATAAGISFDQYSDGKLSPDGRWVAFTSAATDLVAGQQGPAGRNLFLWDRTTGAITLVTHKAGSPLVTASGYTDGFQITTGGSLAFASSATDLVPNQNDTTLSNDVFFWDRVSGKTTLVSRTPKSATTSGNGDSMNPWVSGDGRWVAFDTQATNLLPGAPLPTFRHVLLHDRATGKSLLVSHSSRGASTAPQGYSSGPIVSTGGTWVLFRSNATDLVAGQQDRPATDDLFLFERATGKITLVSHASASPAKAVEDARDYRMTPDGSWIAFTSTAILVAGQTETGGPSADVFLYERATGRNRLASRAAASPLTAAYFDSPLSGLSADGRWVTFSNWAFNMLPNPGADTHEGPDAFVFDRVTGQVGLVSAASPGRPGNGDSTGPVISAEGGWIAFATTATDLVAGKKDLNGLSDVVLTERATAKARLVSLHAPLLPSLTPTAYSQAESLSADGRWAVFTSRATNLVPGQRDGNDGFDDVFLYDHLLHTVTLVSRAAGSATAGGNGKAYLPRISADGRFVIYLSESSNAVPGQVDVNNETPGGSYESDLFLFDRVTETTVLVSHAAGSPTTTANQQTRKPGAISADGRWIVFSTFATDVAGQFEPFAWSGHTYLYDRETGQNTLLDHAYGAPDQAADEDSEPAGISADGNVVLLLSGARNLTRETFFDIYTNAWVLDRTTGLFTLASRTTSTNFPQAGADDALLSADGGTVAFFSRRGNVVPGQTGDEDENLFLWDRRTGVTRLVSHTAGSATAAATSRHSAALSADGRWVVFASYGQDLVPGETDANGGADLYLYDRDTGTNQLITHALGSATTTGALPLEDQLPSISGDGRFVAFISRASNLVSGPAAPQPRNNLFVFDRTTGANTLVSRSYLAPDRPAHGGTWNYTIAGNGTALLFTSDAWDLVPGDLTINFFGQMPDVFLYTLP
jgi:Tol biopolymer transport system component